MKAMRGAMPSRACAWPISAPSTRISPLTRRREPAISDRSVDFPAPSGPTRAVIDPEGKVALASASTVFAP